MITFFFGLVWLIGIVASIVFIFKPSTKWPIVGTRKRAALMLVAVFLGVPLLSAIVSPPGPTEPAAPARPLTAEEQKAKAAADAEAKRRETLEEARSHPERFLEVIDSKATKGGFDTVMILSGGVKNTGPLDIKDPKISCDIYSESNTELGSVSETIYKVVPAGKSIRFSKANMGFVNSNWERYACQVDEAVVLE